MRIELSASEHYDLRDFTFEGLQGRPYAVFDLEGTGLSVVQDAITQIGAVRLKGAQDEHGPLFESLVRPWKPIPPKIEELTGITNARVHDAPEFAEAQAQFREFCDDAVLVTQCGYEYDFPLLDCECGRAGLPALTNLRLDTKAIFALLHPKRTETFSTDFLSNYYSIDRSEFKRHDALGDARLIARIFQAELAEAASRGVDSFSADSVRIKRFIPSPL